MPAGPMDRNIDRAIELNRTVLLVLSKHSTDSDWVQWEASRARKLEKDHGRYALCPVRLDDACFVCDWPGPLRQQIERYNILDFSRWRHKQDLGRQFEKLIQGLDLWYQEVKK